MIGIPSIKFAPGQTHHAGVPFWNYNMGKGGVIHIVQIINEGYGEHVVYRCYGKHKQWWHYFVERKDTLEFYIAEAAKYRKMEPA